MVATSMQTPVWITASTMTFHLAAQTFSQQNRSSHHTVVITGQNCKAFNTYT